MNMADGKLEYVFLKITHFNNSFIMRYTEYFTLRDFSGFLQIRSHLGNLNINFNIFYQ